MPPDNPAPFTLRHAEAADFTAIKALIHQVGINPTGLNWHRFTLAVTLQGEMIGCGQIKPHGDGSWELASIAVTPAWRRQGVARAIIQHLLASSLEASEAARLYLTCRASLGSFYAQFGFQEATTAEMTPYFRRLHHLSQVFQVLRFFNEGMLVMIRDQQS